MVRGLLLILFLISTVLYLLLNRRPSKYYWKSFWDDKIPLVPIFIIPYLGLFPFLIATFMFVWKNDIFTFFVTNLVIANYTASIFWYLFPNGVKRPIIKSRDFFSKVLSKLYKIDKYDTNGFPSNHVFISIICSIFLSLVYPGQTYLFILTAGVIVISVVLVKQHYLIDVIGGTIWALGTYSLVRLLFMS
ncbi:hypothetical protein A2614_01775 [Candidatus Woesebacteria bacterium RIFOXYD1_FULL_40_21]|uniref:Inositolphosphotransferase Aur1/Ipt1 domain-containing protein n=1 Tax=Candidatus Woesebacteria bacterium RIFOXYD1_FULL_40_21 TaxID=1802549 RepID=A0A1F8DEY3_9BACT|nr:MAG: hypothetical protein A2614_01775 [Candidatus Woesebacteria bacterium RIFOXYD1_FULL_40_21]